MPSATPSPSPQKADAVRDVVCLACGCLCDDLTVTVADGQVIDVLNACPHGRSWFVADHGHDGIAEATVDGTPSPADTALDRAAAILRSARAPLIVGLTQTTTETVAAALSLADQIGAAIDWDVTGEASARIAAVQRVGRVSATLGEVKERADLVLFWGADPLESHPRHWERYSVDPSGRFLPAGRASRTVVVIDDRPSLTSARADHFLKIDANQWLDVLGALRALLRGRSLDPAHVAATTGLELSALEALRSTLQGARYGAIFFGGRVAAGLRGSATMEAMLSLTRELNEGRRFVILGLGSAGNASGAEACVTWQTGYAGRVSLAGGRPTSPPDAGSALEMLERRETDAVLIVADEIEHALSPAAAEALSRTPTIWIGPKAPARRLGATVAIDSATTGFDTWGTVTRVDSVTLPLRPILPASRPTDRDRLLAILRRLDSDGPTR